jgi:hypothetical protein
MLFISTKQSDMTILDLYNRANQGKTSTLLPSDQMEYVKQAQAARLGATGALVGEAQLPGNRGAVARLKIQSKLTPLTSDFQTGTPVQYTRTVASDTVTRNNRLTAKTSNLNSGNFQTDIASYQDRTFMQQAIGTDRLSASSANLISAAAQSKPVLTSVGTPGTSAGLPFDDGRYTLN